MLKKMSKHSKNIFPLNVIIPVAVLVFIVRLFFLDIMQVKGHSMEPVIVQGDILFINRLSYGIICPFIDKYIIRWNKPAIGDIIVFYNPNNGSLIVKRCIAAEYDNLLYEDGFLYIDYFDKPLYIGYSLQFKNLDKVPKEQILVLGDNLENSIDSRLFGFVKIDDIIGSVLFY